MSREPRIRTVAVLGAGVMASEMIPLLRRSGFRLRLYNRGVERLRAVAGADEVAATPREAAEGADLICSVVADDDAGRAVWTGPDGALAGLRTGAVAMECSTLSHRWADTWARMVEACGGLPADAPVTGSRPRARSGELIMFLGADDETAELLRPVTDVLTERVYRLGPPGFGTRFKLAHNLLAASLLAALSEALNLSDCMGLPTGTVGEILSTYGWASGVASTYSDNMLSDRHDQIMCRLGLIAKDVRYAVDAAREHRAEVPLGEAADRGLRRVVAEGHGDLDMSAIMRLYSSAVAVPGTAGTGPSDARPFDTDRRPRRAL
ncbi:NAD(P)-dependent oxidoreductase [Nocardiopsis halotolerans]|uniref:NAD(P)-dependent oxidoreductase n=1 Tax=Nocardiopsis halotolerans TaxID=124252 RepID=UPI0003450415|nr:NAD(P)-dependent oxidoreductase [Nocardiopsis halotolerans]